MLDNFYPSRTQEGTAMAWQSAVHPWQEFLEVPENLAPSTEPWWTYSSLHPEGMQISVESTPSLHETPFCANPFTSIAPTHFGVLDRDRPNVLSDIATPACVSFSANEIPSKRDFEPTSCNTATKVGELPTKKDVCNSPETFADYLEKPPYTEIIGSCNEQQQCSERNSIHEPWNTIQQGTISEVVEAAGSSTTSIALSTTCSFPQISTTVSIRKKRRDRVDDEGISKDDKHRRSHKRPRDNSTTPRDENSVKFACPYRKHNPAKYGLHETKICAVSHWSSVSRVKEHLYRCHKAPRHYCERCFHSFSALSDLEFHRMSTTDCASRAVEPPEAITPAVELVLKSRKKAYPNQTEEDRWKCVYRLLFPNEPVPNPYFELVQEEPAHLLGEYEEYSRQELPKLFKSLLEDNFATIKPGSKTWKNELVSAVESCHENILAGFRRKFTTDPTATTTTTTLKPASTTTPACAPTRSSATTYLPLSDETSLEHSIYSFVGSTTDTGPTYRNVSWSAGPISAYINPSMLSDSFDSAPLYPF